MMRVYLAAFQTYLEVERQASPHTTRNYLSDLDQFVRFASKRLEHRSSIAPSPLAGEGWDGGAEAGTDSVSHAATRQVHHGRPKNFIENTP